MINCLFKFIAASRGYACDNTSFLYYNLLPLHFFAIMRYKFVLLYNFARLQGTMTTSIKSHNVKLDYLMFNWFYYILMQ